MRAKTDSQRLGFVIGEITADPNAFLKQSGDGKWAIRFLLGGQYCELSGFDWPDEAIDAACEKRGQYIDSLRRNPL